MKTTQVRRTWRGAKTVNPVGRVHYARTRDYMALTVAEIDELAKHYGARYGDGPKAYQLVMSHEKRGIWEWARQFFGAILNLTNTPK